MSTAIKVQNLSKAYQLGEIGTGTISRDLERWFARIRGKEDPFLQVGAAKNTSFSKNEIVWSLKDINFEIQQGDAVGIIGRNGAGKSTLLKILSKITAPSTGKITGKGRIASLLEVGTGFHPELTGRENIYLNGAILGMRKAEIKRKFDEILDFAGVERYVDTPVKRYSSGMYVRLAFAVAAYLESEILIIDEVLAVGDAEFQKKCLGKMKDVSKGEGRTVLFVSHNMDAVLNLCTSGMVLKNGLIDHIGEVSSCLNHYQNNQLNTVQSWVNQNTENTEPHFTKLNCAITGTQPNLTLTISFGTNGKTNTPPAFVAFGIKSSLGSTIMEATPHYVPFINYNGTANNYTCEVKINAFIPGVYSIYAWLGPSAMEVYHWLDDVINFEVTDPPLPGRMYPYYYGTGTQVAVCKIL